MIKRTMNTISIVSELMSDEYANWTYEGATALAEWYEQLSEDMGQDIEFDRVAIRCDWSEMSREEAVDLNQFHYRDHPRDPAWAVNCEEFMEGFMDELQNRTQVIELDNGNLLVMEF